MLHQLTLIRVLCDHHISKSYLPLQKSLATEAKMEEQIQLNSTTKQNKTSSITRHITTQMCNIPG